MKHQYLYKDVIVDPKDERVQIGSMYWADDVPKTCIDNADSRSDTFVELVEVDPESTRPFIVRYSDGEREQYYCLVKVKESEVKYIPFDLSKKEDRDFLRGKWIKRKRTGDELQINYFYAREGKYEAIGASGRVLLSSYEFLDGTPVGKSVEVENKTGDDKC